ncbi:hypothetical protein ASF26_21555 [Methylobacterium sp. Leaf93]|nr:hypothetical protein ASF26_21555 [Methylobacterium sp. Leaf93]
MIGFFKCAAFKHVHEAQGDRPCPTIAGWQYHVMRGARKFYLLIHFLMYGKQVHSVTHLRDAMKC